MYSSLALNGLTHWRYQSFALSHRSCPSDDLPSRSTMLASAMQAFLMTLGSRTWKVNECSSSPTHSSSFMIARFSSGNIKKKGLHVHRRTDISDDNTPSASKVLGLNIYILVIKTDNISSFASSRSVLWTLCNLLMPHCIIYRSGSTLARAKACCPVAPSHYLNQCWLIVNWVWGYSSDSTLTENYQDIFQ